PAAVSAVFWRRSRALLAIGASCRLAPPSAAAHVRSGRHLEHVLYPARLRPKRPQQAAEKRQQQQRLPSAQSSLVTREDLEAAWNWQAEGTDPAAAASLILSVDCRAMSSEDLALSLRAIAAPYHARHLGAGGETALAALRADPRLTLLECAAAARAGHLGPAQLCHLVRDLCVALRSDPRVTAAPLMLLNSAVNDLPLARLLETLWRLTQATAPPPGPEPALLRRQALVHLRARLFELEAPAPDCAAAARAALLFPGEGELEPYQTARLLSAARRGAARASALDPALVGDAALGWRPLLAWSLPPACRHLSECAEGMFELGAEDLDGLLNSQEALLAALTQPVPPDESATEAAAVAGGLRDFCELGPRVLERLPSAARPDDLATKFHSDRRRLLPLAIAD
ncbi:hypothetical protein BOX15_Mlig011745g4, partial [Macrostomum lignano]